MAEAQDPRRQRPSVEPEIIPPDRDSTRAAWRREPFQRAPDVEGVQRIYAVRLGPVGGVLILLLVVVLAAVLLLAFLGALLIWIPVVALIALVAALSGLLRPRRW